MEKRVLITGASGFFGSHLCRYLARIDEPLILIGTDTDESDASDCDYFYPADLTRTEAVTDLVKQSKPDYIIHLAGTFGTEDPIDIYRSNVISVAALLEATRKLNPDVVFLAAGSAAEYGRINQDQLPVDEQMLCQPVTAYGLSKQLVSETAMYYHRNHQLCTMIVRPFQLIGKGVTNRLAPGAFAEQLLKVQAAGEKVVKVGNLQSERDFLDVQDGVEAIWDLCNKPAPGEIFNLCSGVPVKIRHLLEMMIDISRAQVKIEVDPARLKATADVSIIYGSFQKIERHCGWRTKRPLSQSLQRMFS